MSIVKRYLLKPIYAKIVVFIDGKTVQVKSAGAFDR